MTVLVLEDHPDRQAWFARAHPGCVIVADAAAAVAALSGPRFDRVYLDFDIVGPQNGCDVAWWMRSLPLDRRPALVVVHSSNSRGALGIRNTLAGVGFTVVASPFPPDA